MGEVSQGDNKPSLDEVLERLPKETDVDEVRIVELMRKTLLSTEWAKSKFKDVRQVLITYFKEVLGQIGSPDKIHEMTQNTIKTIAELTNSRIVSGTEHLYGLPKRQPVLAVVNHLGAYKLVGIKPEELGLDLPGMDVIHPFPLYYAPLHPVGQVLGDNLYEAHVQLPEPLHAIQKAAGLIIVPPKTGGLLDDLLGQTRELIASHPNSLTTVFPEGGTSGKRNMGGPYDLDSFKTGAFVIAANLGIPVLPVCQYFNPEKGFEMGILESIRMPGDAPRERFTEIANQTQQKMQNWLNMRKK